LTRFTDLSVLPITAAQIRGIAGTASSPAEWLRAVSDVYAHAGQYGLAADIVGGERAVVLSVCDDKRFEFDEKVEGAGEASGLVKVLRGEEEVGAWVGKNAKWIESQGELRVMLGLLLVWKRAYGKESARVSIIGDGSTWCIAAGWCIFWIHRWCSS
jgi:hypothetical protein